MTSRRRFLAAAASAGGVGLAGCSDLLPGGGNGDGNGGDGDSPVGQIGSARAGRGTPGGTSMEDMPPLEGEVTVYSGRSEVLVGDLVAYVQDLYDDLTLDVRYLGANEAVNQIETAGQNSEADVFFSVNAGALGQLAEAGRTRPLHEDVAGLVREEFRDDDNRWIGTSGRARTIPFNTEAFSGGDVPEDILAFPDEDAFDGEMGWAPSYGSFQAFVTAMRLLEGEDTTRQWLQGMLDSGVQRYPDEYQVCQAIADGEITAGFTNHYYIQRVLDNRPDAPLETAFTRGDAGAIFNVAGAAVVDSANDPEMAANFVRHLLSGEAQDYFARTTFEYPLIPGVEPIGALPTIDELNPPSDLDLTQLSDLEPTIRLMRDAGVDV
ncbi:extracellular solute-binding protein [Natronomonas salina]|uniref:extracellular solute-binding protein n=1 Tax=Natronomonas salina TaxID=1710540 RepID=UPI0015B460FC|nr:extracellular solute-binding protein [Natronomonas salina]QLD89530.1 extracellular solute-binding protein [Natronomonas salina]